MFDSKMIAEQSEKLLNLQDEAKKIRGTMASMNQQFNMLKEKLGVTEVEIMAQERVLALMKGAVPEEEPKNDGPVSK